jgi:dipeptidyl aminopeptidase/acylaminoacyl peptidase
MLFEASPAEDRHEYARSSPLTRVHAGSAPALVVHGACDQGVPPAQGLALHQALRRLGVPTELAHYPGEGHSIQDAAHQLDLAERIVEWFQAMTYQEGTHAPEQ